MLVISAGKIDSYKRELRNRRPIVLLFQKLLTIFIDKHHYHCKLHAYCASIYELDRHRNSEGVVLRKLSTNYRFFCN